MVGQRHRGVADARREQFDQPRGDRAINHGHVDHQHGEQEQHHRVIDFRRIGFFRVTGVFQRCAEAGGEGVVAGLEVGGGEGAAFEALDNAVTDAHLRDRVRFGGDVLVRDRAFRQQGFRQVTGAGESGLAHRIELERALLGTGDDLDRIFFLGDEHVRIAVLGQRSKDRKVGQRRQDAAGHDDRLAPDAIGQAAENHEERCADQQRSGDQQIGGLRVDLQCLQQEEQRIELPGVPDHCLPGRAAQQRHDHHFEVVPACKGFGQRRFRGLAFVLHFLEYRRLAQLQANVHRHGQQNDRQQKRNPPAPRLERLVTQRRAAGENHQQRHEQTEGGGGLNPRSEKATAVAWRVLRYVGCRAAVFTTQRQTLEQTQGDQNHRGGDADGGVAGQQTDDCRGHAHDHDGDQKRVFAPDHVTQAPEDDGAERPHRKPGGEGQQGKDERGGFVDAGEEVLGDDRRQ